MWNFLNSKSSVHFNKIFCVQAKNNLLHNPNEFHPCKWGNFLLILAHSDNSALPTTLPADTIVASPASLETGKTAIITVCSVVAALLLLSALTAVFVVRKSQNQTKLLADAGMCMSVVATIFTSSFCYCNIINLVSSS